MLLFQRVYERAKNDVVTLEAPRVDEGGYSKSSFLGAHPHGHMQVFVGNPHYHPCGMLAKDHPGTEVGMCRQSAKKTRNRAQHGK